MVPTVHGLIEQPMTTLMVAPSQGNYNCNTFIVALNKSIR